MRVRMVLNVPDLARAAMAKREPEAPRNWKGLATRDAVRDFVQDLIGNLIADHMGAERAEAAARVSDEYAAHEVKAVAYLKALGKPTDEIASWLLLQRAISKFAGSQS